MHISDGVRTLDRDLHDVFGARLRSVVVYGAARETDRVLTPTLAVVDGVTAADLRACASRVAAWHEAGLATPLLLAAHEFSRSLEAFPFEFGAILADHAVVSGVNPFDGLRVERSDLRRACEVQARSHLLHLREGFIETEGRGDALADLIARSAGALASLVKSVARLLNESAADAAASARHVERALGLTSGSLAGIVSRSPRAPLSSDEARRLFPGYLDASERLASFVDKWSAA
jgi:hypothetical protein